jgi:hypothetical protein
MVQGPYIPLPLPLWYNDFHTCFVAEHHTFFKKQKNSKNNLKRYTGAVFLKIGFCEKGPSEI